MKHFFYIFFSLILLACSNSEDGNFDIVDSTGKPKAEQQLSSTILAKDWFVGKWSDAKLNPQRQSHEIWWVNEAGDLEAKEFYVKMYYDTTRITKHIVTTNDKNEIEHVITSEGIQGISTVVFKLTAQSKDSLKFENPAHKWPQTIVYRKITNDSMTIKLDGYVYETNKSLFFEMTRYKKYGYEIK